ncbi:MAG: MBL fold metallo-hydrolase [Spirochaetes bacterium]|nr:MBL fold metallo-hydrolase [Spirochaetota bacterium]
MPFEIAIATIGPLITNCYVAGDETNAVIIDPAWEPDTDTIISFVNGRTVRAIVLTHGHFDHLAGLGAVREQYKADVSIHQADADMVTDAGRNLSSFFGTPVQFSAAERILTDGDIINCETFSLKVIHTPGHTAGSICLYTDGHLFSGDTLFAAGVGRTDFPGGDHEALMRSIKERIYSLPGATLFYPGHDDCGITLDERKERI